MKHWIFIIGLIVLVVATLLSWIGLDGGCFFSLMIA